MLGDRLLNLPLMPLGLTLMILHCAIGVIAAIVAHQRGLSLRRWIWIGLLGGTIALIAAWRSPRPQPKTISGLDSISQNP